MTELDAPTDVPVGGRLRIVYNRGNPYAVHGGNNVPYYVGPAAAGAAALGIGAFFVGTFVRRRRRFPGWSPMSLAEATELFTRWPGPWWIAGDRAVDRGLARAAAGPDMTILVTVPKAGMLQALLPGWEIWSYSSWPRRHRPTDDLSRTGTDELWARQADRQPWQLRILLADVDQDAWKPRWDAQSPIPLADLSQAGTDPVKFLIPELALYWQVVAARRPWTSQKIIDAVALLSKSQREKLRQTLNDGGHADAARRVLG
ncbi:hypothetical protein [Pseudofrankia sp. DC12]|uniref:hypothetical protein n=1 Tax=Pseudofrankia sp. DC12 TaxID=683315 RepID=UPI0012F85C30|nr:hypothetical protein [Pseudofrankia sp. DC12]